MEIEKREREKKRTTMGKIRKLILSKTAMEAGTTPRSPKYKLKSAKHK